MSSEKDNPSIENEESTVTLTEQMTDQIIRDAFAMEVFFGDLDGETFKGSTVEVSPPYRYLVGLRSTKGHKAALYLDALVKFFIYYLNFSESRKNLKNDKIEQYIRLPLYIPKDMLELIKEALKEGFLAYHGEQEPCEYSNEIIETWNFFNTEVVPKYLSLIKSEGVLEKGSPSKQMFSKVLENKHAFHESFHIFTGKIFKIEDKVKNFTSVSVGTGDGIFHAITKELIGKKNSFELDFETKEKMKTFMAYNLPTRKGGERVVVVDSNDKMFFYSLMSPERPLYRISGGIKPENLYTIADMLIYSEGAFSDPRKEDALKSIHIAAQLYDDNAFRKQVNEMFKLESKYEEAYSKISDEASNGEDVIFRGVLKELHEAKMDEFKEKVEVDTKASMSAFLEKEYKKSAKTSSFTAAKEDFAFSATLFFLGKESMKYAHLIPDVSGNMFFEKQQKEILQKITKGVLEELIPKYLSKREQYIKERYEEYKASKEDKKTDNKEEKESSETDATASDVDHKETDEKDAQSPTSPEKDTIPKTETPPIETKSETIEADSDIMVVAEDDDDGDDDSEKEYNKISEIDAMLEGLGEQK